MRNYGSYEEYQAALAEDADREAQANADAAAIAELQAQEQADIDADKAGMKAYALEEAVKPPVKEQTVILTDYDIRAIIDAGIDMSVATAVRLTRDIPYYKLPFVYYRRDETGRHIYLFRSTPMKKKEGWIKL